MAATLSWTAVSTPWSAAKPWWAAVRRFPSSGVSWRRQARWAKRRTPRRARRLVPVRARPEAGRLGREAGVVPRDVGALREVGRGDLSSIIPSKPWMRMSGGSVCGKEPRSSSSGCSGQSSVPKPYRSLMVRLYSVGVSRRRGAWPAGVATPSLQAPRPRSTRRAEVEGRRVGMGLSRSAPTRRVEQAREERAGPRKGASISGGRGRGRAENGPPDAKRPQEILRSSV